MENKDVLTLYHGSKSGIDSAIAPMSRDRCDFGKALKLGKQYVAITQKACDRITIIDKQTITEKERILLKQESEANRSRGIKMADEICRKYRRDGRFFDEILNKGEWYGKLG